MERSGQQEQIQAVARRFAEIAPTGWRRLVGNWEATPLEDGPPRLNYVTLAVVADQGRWAIGQLDFDEPLYDLVAALQVGMAEAGDAWTVMDLEVDEDGRFRSGFGYDPPKRTQGIYDHESMGRFESYLSTWVAEKGPVPR